MPPIRQTFESFVNPNARCPVCGEPVFFYQSPYGGRVFFDELGPPWPKHPCTDNTSIPKQLGNDIAIKTPNDVTQYEWQKSGWSPFFIKHVIRIDKYTLQINGILIGCELNLYVRFVLRSHIQTDAITPDCFAHAKKIADKQYDVSLITTTSSPVVLKAYTILHELRVSRSAALKDETKRTSNARAKPPDPLTKPVNQKYAPSKTTSISPNKMALAFADAQNNKDKAKARKKDPRLTA